MKKSKQHLHGAVLISLYYYGDEGFERAAAKQDNIQQNVIAGERRWMRGIRAFSAAQGKE